MSTLALLMFIVASGVPVSAVNDHRGQEFVFGFIENTNVSLKLILTISAETDTDVIIYSHAFGKEYGLYIRANESARFELDGDDFYEGDLEVLDRAIYLHSTTEVSVYCTSTDVGSSGSYLAIPVERLGTSYIAASYDEEDKSHVNISSGFQRSALAVFSVENATLVIIEFKLGNGGTCGNGSVVSGNIRSFLLNQYQAVGVRCTADLTGTIIRSSTKVSVVSGNICTEVPGTSGLCDHLVEMMIPVEYLGTSYVVMDLSFRQMYGTYYRVIGISDTTNIQTTMGNGTTIVKKQEFITYDTTTSGPFCLTADNPVFVVMYVKNGWSVTNQENTGDSFMSVVPSTAQYDYRYMFNNNIRFTDNYTHSFVSVIVDTRYVDGFMTSTLNNVSVLGCCDFSVATVEVTTSMLSLWQSSGETFAAFFYGYSDYEGYGMLAGIKLGSDWVHIPDIPYTYADEEDQCEMELCSSQPCKNGGNCTEQSFSYSCRCLPGFAGMFCEIDVNECSSDPCMNNGTCADQVNSFVCNCTSGYTGATCEIDINECSSDPCMNNGTCADHVNSFVCNCTSGYTGETCDEDFNECLLSPCLNGNCVNTVGSYACVCFDGYTGAVCENKMANCWCACRSNTSSTMDAILKELEIDTDSLSKTRRRRISVYDGRTSSTTIGVGGIAFIVVAVVVIVAGDLMRSKNQWNSPFI